MRAIFVEVGNTPKDDSFFILNYDGEFTTHTKFAIIAGSEAAEDAMQKSLEETDSTPTLQEALSRAANAWRIGSRDYSRRDDTDEDEDDASTREGESETDPLEEALKHGSIEAAILERDTPRESKFRLLREDELQEVAPH